MWTPGIEEGELAQTMLDRRVIELDHGEGLTRRGEGHFRAALGHAVHDRRRPDDRERRDRLAVGEFDEMLESVAPDAQHEPGRERVDDGHADAVQSARNLVGVLIEFPAGVQLGHDDLGRRHAFLVMDAGRNAAAVVGDGAGAVGVERHRHQLRVASQRLVDGVVDHLVDHVVEAGAVVGVADIHARALAHRIEASEHLDRVGAVGLAGRLGVANQSLVFFVQHQRLFMEISRAQICDSPLPASYPVAAADARQNPAFRQSGAMKSA